MAAPPVLDPATLEGLRSLTGPGEPDVLAEVLRMFLQEVPPRMERLRNAWAAANIEELARSAHSLKGSAGNIGANQMFAICKRLDESARAGDLAGSEPLIEALDAEFDKVAAEIQRLIGAH